MSILEYENNNWVQKIDQSEIFPDYNPLGIQTVQDSYTVDFQTLTDIEDIVTKIGTYQVYLDFEDAAGNQSRVIFYFDIVPSAIDVTKSILEVIQRDIQYADNTSFYEYSLSLKDEYLNPIAGKNI